MCIDSQEAGTRVNLSLCTSSEKRKSRAVRRYRWRVVCGALAVCTWLSGCAVGSSTVNHRSVSASDRTADTGAARYSERLPKLSMERLGMLPQAAMGVSLAADAHGNVYSTGGFTGTAFCSTITQVYPVVRPAVDMPQPTHDAATGFVNGRLYILGGGENTSSDSVLVVYGLGSGTAAVNRLGRLASPLSDATAVTATKDGQTGLVLVGGYDDHVYRREVDWLSVGAGGALHWQRVGELPEGLRYAAVAANGSDVYVVGGRTPVGDTNQVYRIDLGSGRVTRLATLPYPVEKAAVACFDGHLLIAGGLVHGQAVRRLLWVDVNRGQVQSLGALPTPLADMGYTCVQNHLILAGGEDERGAAQSSIWIVSVH